MRPIVLLALLGTGCTEYQVSKEGSDVVDDVGSGAPDIEVSPSSIDFGLLPVGDGEVSTQTVTVSNVGDGALQIGNVFVEDAEAPYTVGLITSVLIPAGGQATFTVTFEPTTADTASSRVLIDSDDPDEPEVPVDLTGEGEAPVIQLDPSTYDFGTFDIGCDQSLPVTISNVGNADLVIDSFNYVTASNDLAFDDDETVNGPLPWTLSPSEEMQVYVNYAPFDENADEGYLQIHSNDPFHETAQASQTGSGSLFGSNLDVFEQPLRSSGDILFIVDNSCSMAEEQAALADNFENFMTRFVEADVDFHIGVITTDNPSFQGDFIDGDTNDPVSAFIDQTTLGTGGSGTEMGAEMAWQATQPGADAGPGSDFLRDDALLAFVIVSDEVDSSPDSWSTYLSYFQSLKSDDDDVVWHSIAGDYPSGCATADPGRGYYELSTATGGLYLSICATDWASYLEALAENSSSDLSSFELTDWPVPETIVVRVDGVTVTGTWTYVEADNAVQFDETHIPDGGSTIEVEYALYGDCEH